MQFDRGPDRIVHRADHQRRISNPAVCRDGACRRAIHRKCTQIDARIMQKRRSHSPQAHERRSAELAAVG